MADYIALVTITIGIVLAVGWFTTCSRRLVELQVSQTNGVKMQRATEFLVSSALLLLLQSVWFLSTVLMHFRPVYTDEGAYMKFAMSLRGMVGSILVTALVAWKRWSWQRTMDLDQESVDRDASRDV